MEPPPEDCTEALPPLSLYFLLWWCCVIFCYGDLCARCVTVTRWPLVFIQCLLKYFLPCQAVSLQLGNNLGSFLQTVIEWSEISEPFLCCATIRNYLSSKPFCSYALPYFGISHVFWHVKNNRNVEVMVGWHFIYLKYFLGRDATTAEIFWCNRRRVYECITWAITGAFWRHISVAVRLLCCRP